VKHLFKWGAVFKVQNGKNCRFWEDYWAKEVPLKISHENLFRMVRYHLCSVSECWDDENWDMEFRRALSVQEYNCWLNLTTDLQGCKPRGEANDIVFWALEPKKQFFTKSLYRF
jgi:hypothetical protein